MSNNYTKKDLVDFLSDSAGLSKKATEVLVNNLFEKIVDLVKDGKSVLRVPGFFTFSVKERGARNGINPSTKQKIRIAASKYLAVKISSALKNQINGKSGKGVAKKKKK